MVHSTIFVVGYQKLTHASIRHKFIDFTCGHFRTLWLCLEIVMQLGGGGDIKADHVGWVFSYREDGR